MAVVVGIDSSTQSTKVEARDLATGEVVARGSAPHPAVTPPAAEQHPDAWWDALVAASAALAPVADDVVAVAVAGQQHGLVLLDEHDRPLRPAVLWNDTRSADAAASLVDQIGEAAWLQGCGSVPVASFTVTTLAWLAEEEPDVVRLARRLQLPHDHLTFRLTGASVTDRGDASGTGWVNPVSGRVDDGLLAAAVDDADQWLARLPTIVPFDQPAGELRPDAAAALGLPAGIPVAPGTGDNMAGALGIGLRPGDLALSLGTSGTVYASSGAPPAVPRPAVAGFADATDGFLPLVCTLNATKVTDTVARWLGADRDELAALALAAGHDDVLLVPYLDGERTPNLPDATGSIVGLTTSTTREAIARAAHDGVLCGLLDGVAELAAAGVATGGRVNLVGGGARSPAYRQRCADLLGDAVAVPFVDEAVAAGAAVLAAVQAGHAVDEVVDRWSLRRGLAVAPVDRRAPEVLAAHREAIGLVRHRS